MKLQKDILALWTKKVFKDWLIFKENKFPKRGANSL